MNKKKALVYAGYAAIVIVLVQLLSMGATTMRPFAPERASWDFLRAIQSDRVGEAYYSASKQFQSLVDLDDFEDFIEENDFLLSVTDVNFDRESFEAVAYALEGEIILESEERVPVVFELLEEDGAWRVINFVIIDSEPPEAE